MKPVRHTTRSPVFATMALCILSFAVVMALRSGGRLEYLELAAYDWFIKTSISDASPADPRIVIVEITEQDIQRMGTWPLTDDITATILTKIFAYHPQAVGMDFYRDLPVPPGTAHLNQVLTTNPNIFAVMKFGRDGVGPPPALADTPQVGFNDVVVDPGGIVRRGLLYLDDGETVFTSFAFLLAQCYLQAEGIYPAPDQENPRHLKLGVTTIPPFEANDGGYVRADANGYQFMLDFGRQREPFIVLPLGELLTGKMPPETIENRIVLIGVTAQSVKDLFYTPYSRGIMGANQAIPGVYVHAHIINQLLHLALGESRPVQAADREYEWFWIMLWSIIGGTLGIRLRSSWMFSLGSMIGLAAIWLATYTMFLHDLWYPSVPPALAFLLSAALVTAAMVRREKEQREVLMNLFAKHVSSEVATAIWQQREQFFDGGRPRAQRVAATVLFADLRGYTSTAEKLNPSALIDWLNSFLETMADVIIAHGGVVDDYAGDGIKANFGIPLPRETDAEIRRDAQQAVICAMRMGDAMEELNRSWEARGLPSGGVRIGIYSGGVIAGAIGSERRLKYTTVGDTVNIAARLESFDKAAAAGSCWRVLIGDNTRQYLDNRFQVQRVGEEHLKGKSRAVTIYQVTSTTDTVTR
ncbi:MAG: adenylate/guanylate cyclase domain-containing protein [Deltaproteobacteria bacterium]|nr:adenylate/guanylate cyclase domain-containing protein [Candidatus Anaeroferrophillacea bacterium]